MKEIKLRDGVFAKVDDEDYDSIKGYNWCLFRCKNQPDYACRYIWSKSEKKKTRIFMHRQILPHDLPHTDHIDGDGLNNQKSNLRPATMSQNLANSKTQRNNTSGFKGVYRQKDTNKWTASIRVRRFKGKQFYLGTFLDKNEAARAYDKAAIEAWGEFALTNFPVNKPSTEITEE